MVKNKIKNNSIVVQLKNKIISKDKLFKDKLPEDKLPEGGLLQSKYWTAVLRAEGKDIWRVENIDKEVYCINYKLPLVGKYAYCPRSYNLEKKDFEQIIKQAKDKKLGWVRFDLLMTRQDLVIWKAPHNMQPKQNFIIDINLSEEELLDRMKSKTRYNIRLAKRKGVKILVTREQKYIDKFIDLVEQTAKRKGVIFHEREHYQEMFEKIPEDILQLYVAKYENEVIATNIISFYGGVATYLHGATSDKHRNIMAPFLLQWQAILDAKERGLKYYDFGGIEVVETGHTPVKSQKSSHFAEATRDKKVKSQLGVEECELTPAPGSKLQGITKFKLGFSPKTKPFQTAGSYDVVLNKSKYWMYKLLRRI